MFGRKVRAPLDVVMVLPVPSKQSSVLIGNFVEEKLEKMRAAFRSLRENLGKAAERQKRHYDLQVKTARFNQTTKCGCGAPIKRRVYRRNGSDNILDPTLWCSRSVLWTIG